MVDIGHVVSRVQTDLTGLVSSSATDFPVTSSAGFKVPCAVLVGHKDAWHDPLVDYVPEIVWITSVPDGQTLRCVLSDRGISGTAARSHDGTTGNLKVTAIIDQRNWERLREALKEGVPAGVITMWSGAIADVPAGWALCDGLNGTPDLRDRFIAGAGSAYAVGATGGADAVTLSSSQMPSHSHSGSSSSRGSHNHSIQVRGVSSTTHAHKVTTGTATHNYVAGFPEPIGDTGTNPGPILSDGNHSHPVSIGSAGGSGSHENRPPFLALAYIMKL